MTLSLANLTIRKKEGEVLFSDCSFNVKQGEILTLMGPSGCGKSTLLDIVAGHLSPEFVYQGQVLLNGKRIDMLEPHKRQVGILFQDDLLFPHLNVWENLAFALPNRIKGAERQEHAMNALASIRLNGVANHYPEQLSGGQRARISLTRMLLAEPKAALLDEPFSKLDKELRVQFRDWVVEQLRSANIPALMVTHDEDDIPDGSQVLKWPWESAAC
ncbi:ATP-binding cassette domain-containing protein [Vibrio barjaei]|jgi:putative thiamine transport system ATP-binding protein|uniref:ATP-binding cassette domain-containing protein n=1 Tax=Vibrio barjaei TaxID=1676683 RepID=UPI0007BC121B|nr:ATP-binding cassette domain-containing protein [Vibrio barjaei]OIN25170.1 ABC transporter ATP-binding protein [Vibrio barjaei]